MSWEWQAPPKVWIRDVSPRDGLQAEKVIVSTEDKVSLVDQLTHAGVPRIEVTSFVSPKWLPQMADAEQVMAKIARRADVVYSVLVPNPVGAERALATHPDEMTVFVSASETHNQKNVHRTIDESLKGFAEISAMARSHGVVLSAVIVTAFGCPYEGTVPLSQVLGLAERLRDMGIHELALGDTVGVANPRQVAHVVQAFREKLPDISLALHFHDTRGTALSNLLAAVGSGASRFETALGGIGGSPFSPGAGGNLSTEDTVYCLDEMGIETGIDLDQLLQTARFLVEKLGHDVPAKVFHAGGKMIPVNASKS
ncbi:MAG: hydroxymethylglutaryl-CoA lyase [Sulfobacillus thermosulfidooxidans]|uniref:Hydroxymethylglutaryl-CoA lyase n=1 Tax=Sulfobacillus thermotolerans TaxID=338644 RepID=A0ABN5H0B0_9FIRM|nr:hydroxymethylglutaryl-CoA lyase [Sulfobacillus sp. hq2]AUW94182.1 hydroxymethylglutaryl-CoA lyase [Sulfobacillus thermotolerans]MCY0909085.1 hydroxymethylglutaryl-CoA lyase [Sulfobacillus thermotolerans]POB09550.1 hydroxymethylglutaryl-CoA lyase [Sulfobacillus sp. hq2]PSR36290.1 MAG: hydroxymethylglutaryl-CoA lyase [Sulfobacillus thermosulfidooxidans]